MNNAYKRAVFDSAVWSAALTFALMVFAHEALADAKIRPAANATYETECGSCHLAYPPALLPAPAWKRMLTGLERHFGTDASVDVRSAAEIGAFLEAHAGSGKKRGADSGTLRISETPWFQRKHDEVAAATWRKPQVKSAANCGACHQGAERGDFDEDRVRIPR